ncbi:MAG: Tol-Pal system beta propeller repeat protein TolB [Gammaproteobacteria bacterium]|nr:Tol-Pal system beta propeller repeat protein TolB [Gammaproteobacteria bacterium]MCP5137927.1 Tol-Pal system beta propeller repeat protein TolB [Gammaproteobacteria bacterium]
MRRAWLAIPFFIMSLLSLSAHAVMTIEISEYTASARPIAVVPFAWSQPDKPPQDIAWIVAGDLTRSGLFKPLSDADLVSRPTESAQINFRDWRLLGVENIVIGKLMPDGPGKYIVQFQLFDVFSGEQLLGYSFPAQTADLRGVAHHISDLVFEKLTGLRGAFNTRIAYITSGKGKGADHSLVVADADGYNPKVVLQSDQPLMSPSWSPDGNSLAYVSFEGRKPSVWIQDVVTGKRRKVAGHKGINGAPSWSPDGSRLALTLSKDGDPEIYVLDVNSGRLTRLTNNAGIDTEAVWAPDGQSLVFTSDRSGRPQLYRVAVTGGTAKRITFDGEYNAGASYSPDGKRLAMVNGDDGKYRIAVLDLENDLMRVLTEGSLDESPSFAPNGAMIIYASKYGRRDVLAAVSVDGAVRQRLVLQEGDVREPAWSPLGK